MKNEKSKCCGAPPYLRVSGLHGRSSICNQCGAPFVAKEKEQTMNKKRLQKIADKCWEARTGEKISDLQTAPDKQGYVLVID